ncbi:coth-domain-containing protein [Piromyces finnis]|uniref:Coth-domain-containing protein n=1 Tax=Piromyces finnis TaxID=1754191 RepID=A0A1Y1V4R3_9FUNG|nr:coth-domain-containing protein [Piromyces finnis]|eukprot:ORX47317.1 coth-domain-containing protein [Piromyces finnis]
MKYSKIANLLLVCSSSLAAQVTYNCIAFPNEFGGQSVGLVLNGNIIPMTSNIQGKWNVQADMPTKDFHFAILSSANQIIKSEELSREWDSKDDKSDNYIFGKLNNNIKNEEIAKVPRAYPQLSNEKEFSKLFQEGQVKVINIVADQAVLNNLHQSTKLAKVGANSDTTVEMYLMGDDSVKHFTNVTLSFSGMGSRGFAKRPYKIKLSDGPNDTKDNKSVNGRNSFKLRNLAYDCSYVRQKIVTDVGHAIGVILPQVSFARLYMNGEPYGLYELTDNPKKNWIKKIIHENSLKENEKVGSLYKGVSYSDEVFVPASLNVENDNKWYEILYECENEVEGQIPYTDIKKFINWVSTINNNTSIDEINKNFEVDLFLKYMVIEYLIGHWDGYWVGGNNFYLYKNPITGKYLFMSFDFDLTLGMWDPYPAETFYTNWKSKKSTISPALINKILYNPYFQIKFEEYLETTVQKTFNIYALGPRLDYIKKFLYEDIAWDKTVTPKAVALHKDKSTTLQESLNAFENSSCEADYGLKEWISLRSEFVAKSLGFSISNNVDYSLGSVGNKIIKEKDDKNTPEKDESFNNLSNAQSSSATTTLNFSILSMLIMAIFTIIF